MARRILPFLFIGMLILLSACSSLKQEKKINEELMQPDSVKENVVLQVFAAAPLTEALNEIQSLFEQAYEGIAIEFTFASTSALEKQIEQGAAADLFITETEGSMKALVAKDYIKQDSYDTLLYDELVVIGLSKRKDAIAAMTDLSSSTVNRIAIGAPDSVPAGNYAKAALMSSQLWDGLSIKLVEAKDFKQVLQYVETGNVDAGFVYKSVALSSNKVVTLFSVDPSLYPQIVYPIGQLKSTKHTEEAELLIQFLRSDIARNVFKKHHFTVPEL